MSCVDAWRACMCTAKSRSADENSSNSVDKGPTFKGLYPLRLSASPDTNHYSLPQTSLALQPHFSLYIISKGLHFTSTSTSINQL